MTLFYLMQIAAMLAMVAGFRLLHPRHAVLAGLWLGYLFLPPGAAAYPFPALGLVFEKSSNTALALLLGMLLFRLGDVRQHFRPAWPDLLVLACLALPWVSLATNGFDHPQGAGGLFWMRALHWALPYFLGRVYFADREGLHQILSSMVWAGLAFVPLCLFEMALGPDFFLRRLLLGAGNQGNVERLGGWRPEVFMVNGGLELCAWLAMAATAAVGLRVLGSRRGGWWQAGILLATTLLCRGIYGYALLAIGLLAVWAGRSARRAVWVLALLLAVPPVYIGARLSGALSGDGLVQAVSLVHARGAQSLDWRFNAEEKIIKRVVETNAVWGLGGKKTHHPWPDGLWLHPLVKGGWVGWTLWFGLFLLVPIGLTLIHLGRRLVGDGSDEGDRWAWLLAIMATLGVINGLHNRMYLQAGGLMLGALVSYVLRQKYSDEGGADS